MSAIQSAERPSLLQCEERDYRRVYLASFLLFLVVALIRRVVPGHARLFRSADGTRKSVLAEAREAAHATIGFAFMP